MAPFDPLVGEQDRSATSVVESPAPSAATEPPGSNAALDRMWTSQLRWWHISAAVLLILIATVSLIEPPGEHGRLPTLMACLVIGAAYLLLGARGLRHEDRRYAAAYLVIAWLCVFGVQLLDPGWAAWLFFWVLFPHTWAMLPVRWAVAATAVTLTTSGWLRWLGARNEDDRVGVVVSTLVAMALSVLLGLFIDRAFDEASSRADIIDELRATQAQLAAAEHDRGVLAERERMAQEIHDTLAQGFASILALSRAADSALGRADVETARQRLTLVQATAVENLNEARLIVAETGPAHLQSRTLVEAVQRVVTAVRDAGLDTRFELTGTPVSSGAATDVVLLRATQECLANVRRHAQAATASVHLDYPENGPVTLTIADDGIGFDTSRPATGFGLDGVRARAEQVGGNATIDTEPGRGTTVTVQVPR